MKRKSTPLPRILFSSRAILLGASDLPMLCEVAVRLRRRMAIVCLVSFLIALSIVIGNRLLPIELLPPALLLLLSAFIVSASLASRLGRLDDATKNVEYASNIAHLIRINPHCAKYEASVRQARRPFTRLDLDELGAIHRRNPPTTSCPH